MKIAKQLTKMYVFAVLLLVSFILVPVASAQQQNPNVVHYESGDSKTPSFKGAIVAIGFHGNLTGDLRKLLIKKFGVRDFVQKENACVMDITVICISMKVEPLGQVSGSGSLSGSNARGGNSGYSSYSGTGYVVTLNVDLLKRGEGGLQRIALGTATSIGYEGSGYGSSSGFGRNGSGSSSSGGYTSYDAAIGMAMQRNVGIMFDESILRRLLSADLHGHWFPGAQEDIRQAFPEH